MRSGTKKRMELEERMRKVLFSTMIPMACLMIILLFIFWQYTGQYNKLSENLAVSSEFNLRFKDDLDLEMYYIAIGSKESSNLEDVLEQVEDAQEIMQKLRRNTYNNNGVKSLNSLDSYLENLRQRMLQLVEIKEYDKRMEFMDSNIRIITGLIMQEMQNYIYNESMYLVQVEKSLTHRVKLLISGMAVLLIATLGILMRRSFRLTDGIIQPVNIMLDKVKKVGRGKFDMIPIEAEIEEIEELDEGINKMARKISALLENVRQEKEMQHLTELQLIQAQVNPHFLYNTLDTIVWLIEGGMTDDAVEMISSLSIFFRTSLSKGNDIIPLSEEERHTLSYLEIQQYRYRDILEFEINIPKELSGIQDGTKDQCSSGKCPSGKRNAAPDRITADPGTGKSALSVQYPGHDRLADRGRDDRRCGGDDLQPFYFFPYFTFQRKRYHPALGRRTSYIELSGDPAVPLPGYPGI